MNKQTLITAVASAIAFVLLVINTIAGTDIKVSEDVITSIATLVAVAITWAIGNYKNQDYTRTARNATKIMRKAKLLAKEGDNTLNDLLALAGEEVDSDD